MSASLVGSEMCIRDSPRCLPELMRGARRGDCSRVRPGPEDCGINRNKGPVSYTHLTLPTICSV
eukprot:9151894-Alexandrium_andersonii.AAC.1